MKPTSATCLIIRLAGLLTAMGSYAQSLLEPAIVPVEPPSLAVSFLRLLGALAFVLACFFVGVWLFRNGQRMARNSGRGPRLNVLEVKSLGHRQSLYVVGYEQQRFLISSTPGGVALVTHLPAAESESPAVIPAVPAVPSLPLSRFTFVDALQSVLTRSR